MGLFNKRIRNTLSSNKNKYFVVNQTFVVRAPNKGEAVRQTRNSRSRNVLWSDTDVDNIPAVDAHQIVATVS